MSLDTLQSIQGAAEWIGGIFGLVAAIAVVVILVSGSKIATLQKAEEKRFEDVATQAAADQAIANAAEAERRAEEKRQQQKREADAAAKQAQIEGQIRKDKEERVRIDAEAVKEREQIKQRLAEAERINKKNGKNEVVRPYAPELLPLVKGETPKVLWKFENFSTEPITIVGISGGLGFADPELDTSDRLWRSKRLAWRADDKRVAGKLKSGKVFPYGIYATDRVDDDFLALTAHDYPLFANAAIAYRDSEGWPRYTVVSCIYDNENGVFVRHQPDKYREAEFLDLKELKLIDSPNIQFEGAGLQYPFIYGKELRVWLGFSNDSEATAEIVKRSFTYEVLPAIKFDKRADAKLVLADGLCSPAKANGESAKIRSLGLHSLHIGFTPSAEECEALKSGNAVIGFVGRIEYFDSKKVPYWTNFCITFDGKKFRRHGPFNESGQSEHFLLVSPNFKATPAPPRTNKTTK